VGFTSPLAVFAVPRFADPISQSRIKPMSGTALAA
jgi:hypothetical protein